MMGLQGLTEGAFIGVQVEAVHGGGGKGQEARGKRQKKGTGNREQGTGEEEARGNRQ
jgi:hypothetical protein